MSYVSRTFAHFLGFKPSRVSEWLSVVRSEMRQGSRLKLLWEMAKAATGLGPNRRVWRARIKACMGCPIYDRSKRKCRPFAGSPLGCGCWMPAKALVRGEHCWLQHALPDSAVAVSLKSKQR